MSVSGGSSDADARLDGLERLLQSASLGFSKARLFDLFLSVCVCFCVCVTVYVYMCVCLTTTQ